MTCWHIRILNHCSSMMNQIPSMIAIHRLSKRSAYVYMTIKCQDFYKRAPVVAYRLIFDWFFFWFTFPIYTFCRKVIHGRKCILLYKAHWYLCVGPLLSLFPQFDFLKCLYIMTLWLFSFEFESHFYDLALATTTTKPEPAILSLSVLNCSAIVFKC